MCDGRLGAIIQEKLTHTLTSDFVFVAAYRAIVVVIAKAFSASEEKFNDFCMLTESVQESDISRNVVISNASPPTPTS